MGSPLAEFSLGQFPLQSGRVLDQATLVYQTHGQLNASRDNAVLFPTWYSSKHTANSWLIGPGRALDTDRWFVIVPNLFCNGLSSSPSTMVPGSDPADFPLVTVYDNALAQHRLVSEVFGIQRLALYLGRSMGAMSAFHYASQWPDALRSALMLTGASRCSPHNYAFLASLKAALTADCAWDEGRYKSPPLRGMAAFGRIYAGWMYGQDWYREGHFTSGDDRGPDAVEAFLRDKWDGAFVDRDANDLLAQLATWQRGDVSANSRFQGDFAAALGAIEARCILMPSRSDMYFPPEDNLREAALMRHAEVRVIPSCHGHRAGTAASPAEDIAVVSAAVSELLA